jgi:hypothetical protein
MIICVLRFDTAAQQQQAIVTVQRPSDVVNRLPGEIVVTPTPKCIDVAAGNEVNPMDFATRSG